MTYIAPLDEYAFIYNYASVDEGMPSTQKSGEVINPFREKLLKTLGDAGKFASESLYAYHAWGETQGVRSDKNGLKTPDGWKKLYKKFRSGGWMRFYVADEHAGFPLGLFGSLVLHEMFAGANYAFSLCPAASGRVASVLSEVGGTAQKKFRLPLLASGETVGAIGNVEIRGSDNPEIISTKAVARPDGSYFMTGTKISVLYGDHDLTKNIYYLVTARIAESTDRAPKFGLFLVPKMTEDTTGAPKFTNKVTVSQTEKKLGAAAAPSCVLQFEGARAYPLGEENPTPDFPENTWRIGKLRSAMQSVGITEAAFQKASEYFNDRINENGDGRQGPAFKSGALVSQSVERLLLTVKTRLLAARFITLTAGSMYDKASRGTSADKKAEYTEICDFLTPIAKGYAAEEATELTAAILQIFGSAAYGDDGGAVIHYRDACMNALYDGGPDQAAIDLVTRILSRNDLKVFRDLYQEMSDLSERALEDENEDMAIIGEYLDVAKDDWLQAGEWMHQKWTLLSQGEEALVGASPFLKMSGLILGGYYMAKAAYAALKKAETEGRALNKSEAVFLEYALFYAENFLSETKTLGIACTRGVRALRAVSLRAA